MQGIYLDHSATTPLREEVFAAMQPFFSLHFANPSSIHSPGQDARKAVEKARATVAQVLGVRPTEIRFTSGGTESNNLAIYGLIRASEKRNPHIIVSSIEHPSVLECARYLESHGVAVTYLPVNAMGQVDPDSLRQALRKDTVLISVMLANNEVGAIQPIAEIGQIARACGVPLHVDAVQAAGKLSLRPQELGADLMTLSGHKINGPKGIGILYVSDAVHLSPVFYGGGHEQGLRPGTLNVPSIVGTAEALRLADTERPQVCTRLASLRDRLERGIVERIDGACIHAQHADRLPHITNVGFPNIDGETLLLALDSQGIFVSTGSACSAGSSKPSHVLTAMGIPSSEATCSLRFSLGLSTTQEEVDHVLEVLPRIITALRL
ncbi:MAG: cysteine desulfurase [Deltaproteobacteria bacterium]|nr:cysteine desulfurase [Deltaproteobacteria bacterium]